jgi:hypothetical protein
LKNWGGWWWSAAGLNVVVLASTAQWPEGIN